MKHIVAVNCSELQYPELVTLIVSRMAVSSSVDIDNTVDNLLDSGITEEACFYDVLKIYGKIRSAISRIDNLSDLELVDVYPMDDFMVVETNEIGNRNNV